ncbi:MAG: hypothetical protein ACI4XJ_08750 [Eubacteriales bacterium]
MRGRPAKKRKIEEMMPEPFIVLSNIEILARRYGTSNARICEVMDISEDTLERRRREPWRFTLEELGAIAAEWGMTIGQLTVEPRYIVDPLEF